LDQRSELVRNQKLELVERADQFEAVIAILDAGIMRRHEHDTALIPGRCEHGQGFVIPVMRRNPAIEKHQIISLRAGFDEITHSGVTFEFEGIVEARRQLAQQDQFNRIVIDESNTHLRSGSTHNGPERVLASVAKRGNA